MRKVLALIVCLGAWLFAGSQPGCARYGGNQSAAQRVGDTRGLNTDQRIEDRRTAQRVREALAASPHYRYGGVQVAALNGVVQLGGVVDTKAQKHSAGVIASQLAGVKSVENIIALKD